MTGGSGTVSYFGDSLAIFIISKFFPENIFFARKDFCRQKSFLTVRKVF
jgi:hypothetical protein